MSHFWNILSLSSLEHPNFEVSAMKQYQLLSFLTGASTDDVATHSHKDQALTYSCSLRTRNIWPAICNQNGSVWPCQVGLKIHSIYSRQISKLMIFVAHRRS